MSAPPRFDLHTHSRHSPDGAEPVEALVARAAAIGLQGLALTDHNSIAGHAELADLGRRWPDLILLPGVEVSTREGHLLLYGVRELPPRGRPIDQTLDWAARQDAVPVLAHPFRYFHGAGGAIAKRAKVSAVETRNGHNGPSANRRAEVVRAARGIGATGGSDAHAASDVGRCTTRFDRPIGSTDELLRELRAGRGVAQGVELSSGARARLAIGTFGRLAARGFRRI